MKRHKETFALLDSHFVLKENILFEKHMLRQMSQNHGETVNQFESHLKDKVVSCTFDNVDQIHDQVIDKGLDQNLRRQFLEKADAKLTDVQDIVQVHDCVEQ